MFKLPKTPSPKATEDELADFLEILAWKDGHASVTNVARHQDSVDDNIDPAGEIYEGIQSQEDEHLDIMESVAKLIEERQRICGDSYPFELEHSGFVLKKIKAEQDLKHRLYLYLLCATRLNMKSDKIISNIDGTLLMEDVGGTAIQGYLGSNTARVFVMGTSSGKVFKDRVAELTKEITEPGGFKTTGDEDTSVHVKDDGVDVIGWIPFKDNAYNKLIVFAQAKTGTNWRDNTYQCQPESFQNKWLSKHMTVSPIRAFCVAESVSRGDGWANLVYETGIFFDRCRIVSCFDTSKFTKGKDLKAWLAGAKENINGMFQGRDYIPTKITP